MKIFAARVSAFTILVVLSLLLGIASPTLAWNYSDDTIPNGAVFSCNTCHNPDNQFERHYRNQGNRWTTALAAMDSDGDGWTNGQELLDPAGTWQQGDADPGDPSGVTNPGRASSHPSTSPTPTPLWTSTPTRTPTGGTPSTPTRTPTPGTTSTPTSGTPQATATPVVFTVDLTLNQSVFHGGDLFDLRLITIADGQARTLDLYIMLDVYGYYYFYPSWTTTLEFETVSFQPWETDDFAVLQFTWPDGVGYANGLFFWAAYLDSGTTTLVGNIDKVEFGYL